MRPWAPLTVLVLSAGCDPSAPPDVERGSAPSRGAVPSETPQGPPRAAPDSLAPLEYVGTFSDVEVSVGEDVHEYGHTVELWRHDGRILGFLLVAEGLAGDTPTGVLEDASLDPGSGALSFQARLSTGWIGGPGGEYVRTRDFFEFSGTLEPTALEGTLTRADSLDPRRAPTETRVILRRTRDGDSSGPVTLAEWQARATRILEFRGPRW